MTDNPHLNTPVPVPYLPDGPPVPWPWDALTAWNAAMLTAVDGLQACSAASAAWQEQSAQFLDRRIAGNHRAWAALSASRDVAGVIAAQQAWAREAASDYTKEVSRLSRFFTTLCLTGTTPAVQNAATLVA